jgi:hypothetical protein
MLCSLHITDPLHTIGIYVCLTLLFLLTLIYSVSSNYHNNCYDLQQIIVGDMNVLVQVSLMWSVEHCKILHQINLQSRTVTFAMYIYDIQDACNSEHI